MHGGAWEWTDSTWGRGTTDPELGVLRGGNSAAGELVGRCANGIGRSSATKGATMGFRCCAGPANPAKVTLRLAPGASLEKTAPENAAPLAPLVKAAWFQKADAGPATFTRVWTWRPVPNEELVIAGGCAHIATGLACGAVIGRIGMGTRVLAEIDSGRDFPDVAQLGDARHIRVRGLEYSGALSATSRTCTGSSTSRGKNAERSCALRAQRGASTPRLSTPPARSTIALTAGR